MLAEEAKACFSPWSTCWLHSSLEFEKSQNRNIVALLEKDVDSGIDALAVPGLKVLHIQDLDYESTCYTFISCLTEIKTWSDNNPDHLPITVLVEAKDEGSFRIPDC
ncbi:Ca2+-dependent phosphoinositide-specific phospholipase C [Endozoicomonas atrinae]|uniref:Ca2+-dependent phosphoinositide-specific phospholipase C n=1 Tax=Endozoicomonas atrinae TaxID=1333660 RepID=UPI003B00135C